MSERMGLELKSVLAIALIVALFSSCNFVLWEGGVLSAQDSKRTVIVKQAVTAELSLEVSSSSVTLLPSLPGLTGGKSNASTTVNVITNNKEGYGVFFQASMETIEDWSGGEPLYPSEDPEVWQDAPDPGGAPRFGFGIINNALSSANFAPGYGDCDILEKCWSNVPTTTPKVIIGVNNYTSLTGDFFQLNFRLHLPANSSILVPEGWYEATTTLTAVMI